MFILVYCRPIRYYTIYLCTWIADLYRQTIDYTLALTFTQKQEMLNIYAAAHYLFDSNQYMLGLFFMLHIIRN